MIFKVHMKTPDCLHYALEDCPEDERAEVLELCQRWFQYNEAVTLQIDTEKQTCKVI